MGQHWLETHIDLVLSLLASPPPYPTTFYMENEFSKASFLAETESPGQGLHKKSITQVPGHPGCTQNHCHESWDTRHERRRINAPLEAGIARKAAASQPGRGGGHNKQTFGRTD